MIRPTEKLAHATVCFLLLSCAGGALRAQSSPVGLRDREDRNRKAGEVRTVFTAPKVGLIARPDGWSAGFRKAGERVITVLGEDRLRLEYSLATHVSDQEVDLGSIRFLERWLLETLRKRFSEVLRVEILDRGTARTDGRSVHRVHERLVAVTGSRETIERVEAYLDLLKRRNRADVELSVLLVSREGGPSSREVDVTPLTPKRFAKSLARLKTGGAERLADLVLRCRGGETAEGLRVDEMAYIEDWELENIRDTVLANPIVGRLEEGYSLYLTPIVDADGERLHLHVDLRLNTLKRPIPEFTTTLGDSTSSVTVQLPEFSTLRMSTEAMTLEENEEGFHLRGPGYVRWEEDGSSTPRTIELMIRARVRDPERLEAAVGKVLGFDPENHRVFVRPLGRSPGDLSGIRDIMRDGKIVGSGKIVEDRAGLLILALTSGEAREGDDVH